MENSKNDIIKNDKSFKSYLDKKGYVLLSGKELIETLKDDYNAFVDEKDEVSFEEWTPYKEGDLDNDFLYVVDSDITLAPEIAEEVKVKYDTAKNLIMKFISEEYEEELREFDYENLEDIGIAHTQTEDGEHDIDVKVDLINNTVSRYLNDEVIKRNRYNDLDELINEELWGLDFDELIGEHEVEEYLKGMSAYINDPSKKKSYDGVRGIMDDLVANNYKDFVKALVSIENEIENEKALDIIYDNYMDNDEMRLLNDELSYKSVREFERDVESIIDFYNELDY